MLSDMRRVGSGLFLFDSARPEDAAVPVDEKKKKKKKHGKKAKANKKVRARARNRRPLAFY